MLADDLKPSAERQLKAFSEYAGPGVDSGAFQYQFDTIDLVSQAARFALEPSAIAAVQNVAAMKPSSIEAALSFVKLPAPLTWIEWPDAPRQEIRERDYGQLRRDPIFEKVKTYPTKRVGILAEDLGDGDFAIRVAYKSNLPETGEDEINFCFGRGVFNAAASIPSKDELDGFTVDPTAEALIRKPEEMDAWRRLAFRFSYEPIPEAIPYIAMMAQSPGATVDQLMTGDSTDVMDEALFSLACLILFNTRNGVEHREVDLRKLNKARGRSGRMPLLEYRATHLRLGRAAQRGIAESGWSGSLIGHFQRGHFKVRDNGLFWWNGHFRGDMLKGFKPPRYRVT
jgi:hypothetical protein